MNFLSLLFFFFEFLCLHKLKSESLSTEKMSVLKPAAKQPRLMGQSQVKRSETVGITPSVEANDPPTTSLQTTQEKKTTPSHPKGHKCRELSEVWENMDKQKYLHLTDTLTLGDVWVQPTGAVPSSTKGVADVDFIQIVASNHFKYRTATSKLSTNDLLKMLFLADCINYSLQGYPAPVYDDWVKSKSKEAVGVLGMKDASDESNLCNYIITRDKEFSFFPAYLNENFGIFFRKVCCHSYKGEKGTSKCPNPNVIKCKAENAKFEYLLEARLFQLPKGCEFYRRSDEQEEMPETQPL